MSLWTLLNNERGQSPFFGNFLKGLSEGIARGEEFRQQRERLKLQQQQLKLQERKSQLDFDEAERRSKREIAQDKAREEAAGMFEQPGETYEFQPDPQAAIGSAFQREAMGQPPQPFRLPSQEQQLQTQQLDPFAWQKAIVPPSRQDRMIAAQIRMEKGIPAAAFKQQDQQQKMMTVGKEGWVFNPATQEFYRPPTQPGEEKVSETAPTTNEIAIAASGGGISPRLRRLGIDNQQKATIALNKLREMQQQQINIQAGQRGFTNASTLRKEYLQQSKEFTDVRNSFNRIQRSAQDPSAAGDLAMIFNFMKMLDPTSVVRESEFATAANAAGVPDRIRNTYNRIVNGERLAKNQRADFLNRAQQLFDQQAKSQLALQHQYRGLAIQNQIDPNNVIVDLFTGQEPVPGATPPKIISITPIPSTTGEY